MLRLSLSFFAILLFINGLTAQTDAASTERLTAQMLNAVDADLNKETQEVEDFARKLASLKAAFAEKDASKMVAYEAYVLRGMRIEADQMLAKANTEAAQTERRKTSNTGQITPPAKLEEAPARDPFAEATTPTEIRLEKMTYTMAAFERHTFDPAKPEAAARDFAKLDEFLKIMQEELAELKKTRQ